MLRAMATQPIDTAKLYALTAGGACSVTLTQGQKSITWQALTEGGQTQFIVPAGATISISDPEALLSPLPANFKAALGAGGGRTGGTASLPAQGERIVPAEWHDTTATVTMQHATWSHIPATATQVELTPALLPGLALQMQLVYTPTELMTPQQTEAWLVGASWLYGAPMMGAGIRYVITLTEAFGEIKANATAWGGAPTA